MKIVDTLRAMLVVFAACASMSSASYADSGYVTLTIYKAGWIIGSSGGRGILHFHGRDYAITTGGLDYGASCLAAQGP